MNFEIHRAEPRNVDELLHLYFAVYKNTYPHKLGTDRETMESIILDHDNHWLLAFDAQEKLIGSLLFQVDTLHRIACAAGLVVKPECRGMGVASALVREGSRILLDEKKMVNSIYATTRTLSKGPQLVFLKEGYLPLGIFPNAHKLNEFETLTFLAKVHPDAIAQRAPVESIPAMLGPIVELMNEQLKISSKPKLEPTKKIPNQGAELEFELIFAPHFVRKIFDERFTDPYDRFFPFHEPNLLMSAKNREVEIFAHYSEDGYCSIVALTEPCWRLAGRIRPLLHQLRTFGVSYVEILLGLENTDSVHALLGAQFLPSALYPAMYSSDGKCHDMVLMSRTMEPLDFRGVEVEKSLKPFVDQYINLWKKMHLDVLETF